MKVGIIENCQTSPIHIRRQKAAREELNDDKIVEWPGNHQIVCSLRHMSAAYLHDWLHWRNRGAQITSRITDESLLLEDPTTEHTRI